MFPKVDTPDIGLLLRMGSTLLDEKILAFMSEKTRLFVFHGCMRQLDSLTLLKNEN